MLCTACSLIRRIGSNDLHLKTYFEKFCLLLHFYHYHTHSHCIRVRLAAHVFDSLQVSCNIMLELTFLLINVVICGHLWHDFRKSALRRLIVGYNHSFRFLMKFYRNCSASGMFVSNCVPSFMEMWRKYMVLPSA